MVVIGLLSACSRGRFGRNRIAKNKDYRNVVFVTNSKAPLDTIPISELPLCLDSSNISMTVTQNNFYRDTLQELREVMESKMYFPYRIATIVDIKKEDILKLNGMTCRNRGNHIRVNILDYYDGGTIIAAKAFYLENMEE